MVGQRSHSIILPSSPLLNDDPSFTSVDDPPSPIFRIPSPIIHPVVIPSIPCDPIPYKRRTESDATIRPSVKQLEREKEDWEDVDMTPMAEKETFIFFDIEEGEKEEEGSIDKWLL
ncbi:hypothetical protein L202_06669 [Cryptococcus amylolentus CBS 6039]|uniref:Uncharacterized protein n=1 Tax=Cryptococcus amylolentus CBS 6039 TaxID=1295533 RepID=A0A1E3HGS0_9TREE|nr:hypothetical protein L202_06669 [Cryptococcus amylolentus CBS 6039]ODN75543.1 hypothetical protein L202_06669 [Cryptococcus amylolentus CBS 6039]